MALIREIDRLKQGSRRYTVRTVLPIPETRATLESRFAVNLGGHGLASARLTFGPSRPPLPYTRKVQAG